jgi:anaerobic selenocysteine-containing dehydrogenase
VDKPAVPVERGLRPGSESFVLTTCGLCQAGCGLRVRVVDGRAVKVEGNAESPVNRGGVCARGQAGLELLYHPDRIRGPRRRVGARGGNRWQAISWDEAIAQIASALGQLRAADEPQSLVLLDGEQSGTTHALWARFLEVFGSPNHVGHGATGFGAMARAVRRMTRRACLPGYDFERSRCVLLVGTGALESSPQLIHLARALAGETRPRLLCASPRLPAMAVLVDEWLSLAPGGSAALLLGLLHILLREQLGDESALEVASGFAPWTERNGKTQAGLRAQLMTDFTPEKIEGRIGIPAARIADLARELVATRPSMVVVDEGMCDDETACAALLVNALLGSINVPGGMLLDPGSPRVDLGEAALDGTARLGLRAPPIDGRESREPGQRDFETSRILALPEAFLSAQLFQSRLFQARWAALARGHRPGSFRGFLFAHSRRIGALCRSAFARSHLFRTLGRCRAGSWIPSAFASPARGAPACGHAANGRGHPSHCARPGGEHGQRLPLGQLPASRAGRACPKGGWVVERARIHGRVAFPCRPRRAR